MAGFTKLFSTIVHSTVWREDMHVKIVWITMLALADPEGEVMASLPGLADVARVSLDECEDALARLMSPDQYSRTKDFEGRRIEEVSGGWRLLNYQKYREAGIQVATLKTKGYVYYASLPGRIKIGFSKNPWARMADLKVTAPSIKLLATEPGTLDDETERQQQFAADHLEGEWFKDSKRLMAHIKSLTTTVATVATEATTKEEEVEVETDKRKNGSDRPGARSNPLVAGRRGELETEALALVRSVAALTGEDPAEIMAEAAAYEGAQRTKTNPASMTDDRLMATVLDLRATLKAEQKKRAKAPA